MIAMCRAGCTKRSRRPFAAYWPKCRCTFYASLSANHLQEFYIYAYLKLQWPESRRCYCWCQHFPVLKVRQLMCVVANMQRLQDKIQWLAWQRSRSIVAGWQSMRLHSLHGQVQVHSGCAGHAMCKPPQALHSSEFHEIHVLRLCCGSSIKSVRQVDWVVLFHSVRCWWVSPGFHMPCIVIVSYQHSLPKLSFIRNTHILEELRT